MTLDQHLTAPLDEGGHDFKSLELYPDLETLHTDDHRPDTWFAEVITHTHGKSR